MKFFFLLAGLLPLQALANNGWVELSADYQHYSKGLSAAQTLSLNGSLKQEGRTIFW